MPGSGTRVHTIWQSMKRRCQTPSNGGYHKYGARGVAVCEEWQRFLPFLDWALANGYADDREIDRIQSSGRYEPDNCRWIAPSLNRARRVLKDGDGVDLSGLLTDDAIIAAQDAAERVKLADGRGLHLQVMKSGVASWWLNYTFNSETRILSFGRYPAISLAEARELREVAKRKIRRGVNPA